MPIDEPQEDIETISRNAGFLKILAQTLQSGVSIMDEDMNYLFLSDSVYDSIGATREELKPGDPLSKCHEIMVANGLLTDETLKGQDLSATAQIQRNAIGEDVRLQMMCLN